MSNEGPKILQLILDEVKTIRTKADEADKRLDSIDVTLGKQHVSLEEHIKRSERNEKVIEIVKDELKDVQQDIVKYNFILKIIGLILGSGGLGFLLNMFLR